MILKSNRDSSFKADFQMDHGRWSTIRPALQIELKTKCTGFTNTLNTDTQNFMNNDGAFFGVTRGGKKDGFGRVLHQANFSAKRVDFGPHLLPQALPPPRLKTPST
jgi:hypothetical protein